MSYSKSPQYRAFFGYFLQYDTILKIKWAKRNTPESPENARTAGVCGCPIPKTEYGLSPASSSRPSFLLVSASLLVPARCPLLASVPRRGRCLAPTGRIAHRAFCGLTRRDGASASVTMNCGFVFHRHADSPVFATLSGFRDDVAPPRAGTVTPSQALTYRRRKDRFCLSRDGSKETP